MKTINLLIILLSLLSCESKSQEKIAITKLSQEDKNTVVKLLKDSNFEIESIKKIDSSQNVKTVSHYNNNYSQYEKKIYTYDQKNRIEIEKNYVITPLNREFLELMYETKYSYAGKNIIAETIIWRNNMQYGKSENKKIFDEEGKIIEEISESKSDEYEKIITQKKTYKYNIDKAKNKAIVCIEEYQSYATPKTFETCNTYHYESGKITKQEIENTYQYDNKNRLIKEIKVDSNGNPHFEDLYIYDDKNKSMEFQRYRFDDSRFLALKEQTYYNKQGNIEKHIIFKLNENNKFEQQFIYYSIYNNNKKVMEIELKSKSFNEKEPSLPR